MIAAQAIFTVRPWDARDGDAGNPHEVLGVAVTRRIQSGPDGTSALVALDDGRYAVTGPTVAVGSPTDLRRYLRRRARRGPDRIERDWLNQAGAALRALHADTGRPLHVDVALRAPDQVSDRPVPPDQAA